MKKFIRKIWDAIVTFISKVSYDKLLHFIAGLIIAALCAMVFKWGLWCIIPAIVFGLLKELFDWWTTRVMDWKDFIATACGGLVIFLFALF